MKSWRSIKAAIIVFLFFVGGSSVQAEPVTGYSSYIRLLPGGTEKQAANFALITAAQDEVRALEAEKRRREIKFERPVDIFFLNATYTMISFEVFFRPMENSRFSTHPAIFALLFEGTDMNGIRRYTSRYIKWIGELDLEEYRASQINDFCDYFRRAGVEDCLPVKDSATAVASPRRTAPAPAQVSVGGAISGDMITRGVVKEAYIDPAIVRKKDFDAQLGRQGKTVEALGATVKTLQAKGDDLDGRVLEINRKIDELAVAMAEDHQARTEWEAALDPELMNSMARTIEEQEQRIRLLSSKLADLQTLLDGVSRRGNTLLLTGANLQIVNGSGVNQGADNGAGNLIVGYEDSRPSDERLSASHQIIQPTGDVAEVTVYEPAPEPRGLGGRCFIGSLWE
ncbi:hypothetical protein JCM14469_12130 [Desulfatiferula olefinivorans]